jgi:hypothetical protein
VIGGQVAAYCGSGQGGIRPQGAGVDRYSERAMFVVGYQYLFTGNREAGQGIK